ncbi:substrate-binding periplasmic protein [Paraburkholderia silvatlantica]|uniref:Polar amino acid transport system substrate-binding protein n=1 Tax=Paraburkholderia silvatlantica TaxID=321895 RepID=A0ABR6FKD6_9BURK|nr:transporter substrate-binding domain-containing protein [Paraburkholderia silvatlantica]MBB2927892.1 polar amino acid transport system substrate-binding protein [Paraburkholderia silvatlantica]PVY27544.1 amino acid ABC transporter substrate-binding protein (PAAT family) [Paraburkholderia silvatlantica]PXW34517.1 amino acid ABC transporter substrate-binding protein (PAAT family) [Paraburkholderia silvatlantica]
MTSPMRRLSFALVGLYFAGLGATAHAESCKPAHQFETIRPGTLSVAVWDFPPYSIPAGAQDIKGVDGEIVKRIAARECLKISVSVVDPAAVVQSVVSRRADIGLGDWYRTADRAKVLGLSGPMYLDQMAVISKQGVDTVGGIVGKRVGTVQGYLWTGDLQKLLGSALVVYPNPVAMAQDLAAGRIDAGTDSYAVSQYNQTKGGYPAMKIMLVKPDARVPATLEPGQTALLFTKTNAALGTALSANIEALRQSGEIARILKTYGLSASAAEVGAPRIIQ